MALLLSDEEAKQQGLGGIGNGILMPLLSHRFQIRFTVGTKEQRDFLTRQTVNFRMDFKNKTISFDIEQPACVGDMVEIVDRLVGRPGIITAEILDGNVGVMSAYQFSSLECISHSFDLDYAGRGDAVRHKIVMRYEGVRSV